MSGAFGLVDLAAVEMVFLVPALVILLVAYRPIGKWTACLRAVGSALFGFYWLAMVPYYMGLEDPDVVNAALSGIGAALFLFIAYQLYLDHRWDEETRSIEWLLRMSALTGAFYFLSEHVPALQGSLIYIVAHLTGWVLQVSGFHYTVEGGFPSVIGQGLEIRPADPSSETIQIVFACTAALAMFLFTAAIISTRSDREEWVPWAKKELSRLKGSPSLLARSKRWGLLNILRMSDDRRKLTAFLMVVPFIFVINIFRNVGVILAVNGGLMDFYTAHNVVAKALSLLMMMFLTWVLFEYMPELQENMVGLFDLRHRFRKGMIKNGRVDLKYVTSQGKRGKERV
jgi:exosortase/archaeosortase family protein